MREHWANCITHFDDGVDGFIADYFAQADRRCLLVAGAGFDPRARTIASKLSATLGDRISALLFREERGEPAQNLVAAADDNEAAMCALIERTTVQQIQIFAQDGAPVAGARIGEALRSFTLPDGLSDIVLDMSALSIGVGFPVARYLLEDCERRGGINLHLMIVSNPELDARIVGEPDNRVINVRGYSGQASDVGADRPAKIWAPQLAHRKREALGTIRAAAGDTVYKICPILPFPARNPRRADELISEYEEQLRAWEVDARDLIYVSERNPLDSYRTLSMLKARYDQTVRGVFTPQLILSPIGSKVMAAGAMMAAIEHELPVQYVETLRYDFDSNETQQAGCGDMVVHVWLQGPIYAGFGTTPPADA